MMSRRCSRKKAPDGMMGWDRSMKVIFDVAPVSGGGDQ